MPADVYSGVADTTYVSPATLHSVLYYPDPGFTFGGGTPIVINASSIATQALSGPFIGSESDIATSTGKLVTGAAVHSWMTDLPSVGHLSNAATGTVGTIGKFSSVTAKTIYANVGDATVQGQGFFEVLTCERVAEQSSAPTTTTHCGEPMAWLHHRCWRTWSTRSRRAAWMWF